MMGRLRKITDFEVPEHCKEPYIPKSKRDMKLPKGFTNQGINKLDEEYKMNERKRREELL